MVSLPRMGLGMAAIGRPGYINLNRGEIFGTERTVESFRANAFAVLDTLFQNEAVPWIDAARSYGLSEQFLGDYLKSRQIDPASVYVSSKWGYSYVANFQIQLEEGKPHEIKDHSTANFLKQLEETKSHIGDYVNLYQIHSATFDSGILTDTTAHEALYQCKQKLSWKLGLSVSGPTQDEVLRAALQIRVHNQRLFDSVQCTYNVLEQRPGAALLQAHEAGWDIIIKEGLANGRVLQHPVIVRYAKELQCEPDQLALAVILKQPFAPHVLSGAALPSHLESNLKAQSLADDGLDDATCSEIAKQCCMESNDYWKERSALEWN